MNVLGDKDHALVRRDTVLRGLPLLLDAQQLRRQLQSHVDTSSLDEFKLSYVRYKPGMNCLGRYEFKLGGETGIAYAKAFAGDAVRKLTKSQEVAHIEGPLGPGSLMLPESNLFVSFFPNDLRLRSIIRLAGPATKAPLLKRIFHGSDDWEESRLSVLNYKPERRLVVRLSGQQGRVATVKFHTEREFSRISHLRRPEPDHFDVPVPRRIGDSRKHCAFAFSWIAGNTLRECSGDSATAAEHFHAAGGLIANYHASSVKGLSAKDKSTQVQVLDSMAEQLVHLMPELGVMTEKLVADLRLLASETPAELCPVHGDFYDKQVIVGADGLSLIDLDRTHLGTGSEDLACFLAHQEWRAIKNPAGGKEQSSSLSDAFLDGYLEAGGQFDEKQLAGWTALYLFRLSHKPFRDRDHNWPSHTTRILQRAIELLQDSQQADKHTGGAS